MAEFFDALIQRVGLYQQKIHVLSEMNKTIACDISKAQKELGYDPQIALKEGRNIEIRGFGTYKIVKRKARVGRNPKNSEIVQIPEKKAIKWKIGKNFFKRLNKNFTENEISDNY